MAIQRVEIQRSRLSSNINELSNSLRILDNDFIERINGVRASVDKILITLEDRHRYRMNTLQRQVDLLDRKVCELPDPLRSLWGPPHPCRRGPKIGHRKMHM